MEYEAVTMELGIKRSFGVYDAPSLWIDCPFRVVYVTGEVGSIAWPGSESDYADQRSWRSFIVLGLLLPFLHPTSLCMDSTECAVNCHFLYSAVWNIDSVNLLPFECVALRFRHDRQS